MKNESNPASIYLFEVKNRDIRNKGEICSKLTIKTPEQRQWRQLFKILLLKHVNKVLKDRY